MSDIIFCILKLLPITEVYFSETYVCIYIYIYYSPLTHNTQHLLAPRLSE